MDLPFPLFFAIMQMKNSIQGFFPFRKRRIPKKKGA